MSEIESEKYKLIVFISSLFIMDLFIVNYLNNNYPYNIIRSLDSFYMVKINLPFWDTRAQLAANKIFIGIENLKPKIIGGVWMRFCSQTSSRL